MAATLLALGGAHCGAGAADPDGGASDTGPAATGGPLGAERDGIITYYSADGSGNCSYEASPGDLLVAAMNQTEYANSAACGTCVRVTGPRGTVRVRIVDRCPECAVGHLDMSESAFAMVADPRDGRVAVRWQPETCDVRGPVSYRFKEGSSQWWTAIQVRNHRVPVRSLEARVGSDWVALERQEYNYFVASSGLGPGPYVLRVTAQDGRQFVDENIALADATVVPGHGQFQ